MDNGEMTNVVFDLETYSTQAGAMILTFGATLFSWDAMKTFEEYRDTGVHLKLDRMQQRARHVDLETVDWWATKTSESARDTALSDNPVGMSPSAFARALTAWAQMHNLTPETNWYCRGPHFDAAILEDFARQYQLKLPYGFWQVRDVRTFMDHFQEERLGNPPAFIPHNALNDAAWDAYQMVWWSQQ